MAIVRMKKLLLIGLESEKEKVLQAIQETGSVEVEDITALADEELPDGGETGIYAGTETERKLADVKFAVEFLERYNDKKKKMFAPKPAVTFSELYRVMDEQDTYMAIADRCKRAEESLTAVKSRRARLSASIEHMKPWKELGIPLESITETEMTRLAAGTLNREKASRLQTMLEDEQKEIELRIISEDSDTAYCLIIYHKELEGELAEILREYDFARPNFTGLTGTPAGIIAECEEELKAADEEEKQIVSSVSDLVSHIDNMKVLYDGLNIELEKYKAAERILHTGRAYLLKGWVTEHYHKKLAEKLLKLTDAIEIQFEEPSDDDVIPVVMENRPVVQPFEVVTSLYSTPSPKGIDPNPYMAPFYFIFFGIMLGDAAYGLIMAIVCAVAAKVLKLKGAAGKLVWLMSICGVSTLVWGALFGSWFGDIGEKVAPLFGLKTSVILFNPMEEPLLMLGLCFGLGLIHVIFGMCLKAYLNIRDGHVWDAVFDQGFWIVLIAGLLLLVLPATASAGKIIALAGAVGLVLTQGRSKKNIFAKFFSGLLSLYGITGIFSDVLSYSRLFALGLATGIIGMVINILVFMLGESWFGLIFAVAIFIGGHAFNLVINVLGSFVHASRLQYIEFFGKFFEGGGHAFQPLAFKTKYIDLIN